MRSTRHVLTAAGITGIAAAFAFVPSAAQLGATPMLPTTRVEIDDLTYAGAFRVSSETFGESSTNYAVGALAFNPANDSLFIAGHAHHNAIAEFAIPEQIGTASTVEALPLVEQPLQQFSSPLDDAPTGNPDGIDRINGMFVDDGDLIVNAERWYDAGGTARDTTLVVDAADLDGSVAGYFELDGAVHAGGYMSTIPSAWQSALGAPVLTGWASNTSIISRHSVGPSLFAFDPDDVSGDATLDPIVSTRAHMNFPYAGARWLTPNALDTSTDGASPLWNFLAKARYGFIVPGTSSFLVLGSIGGVDSGIGYKITQDDGNLCGGYCAYRHDDYSNAYWLFDVNDILAADQVHLPRPYAFGSWSVPFDDGGRHSIIGATFDEQTSRLYVALENAGQVGTYDRPPLVVAFDVDAPGADEPADIDGPAHATEPADRISRR